MFQTNLINLKKKFRHILVDITPFFRTRSRIYVTHKISCGLWRVKFFNAEEKIERNVKKQIYKNIHGIYVRDKKYIYSSNVFEGFKGDFETEDFSR